MNRHLLGKNSDTFPQNPNFLANHNANLKNRCQSKIILGHAVFQWLSKSTFSLKLSLLLNNSIN